MVAAINAIDVDLTDVGAKNIVSVDGAARRAPQLSQQPSVLGGTAYRLRSVACAGFSHRR